MRSLTALSLASIPASAVSDPEKRTVARKAKSAPPLRSQALPHRESLDLDFEDRDLVDQFRYATGTSTEWTMDTYRKSSRNPALYSGHRSRRYQPVGGQVDDRQVCDKFVA